MIMNEQKKTFHKGDDVDDLDGNDVAVLKNDGSENNNDDDDITCNWRCCMK